LLLVNGVEKGYRHGLWPSRASQIPPLWWGWPSRPGPEPVACLGGGESCGRLSLRQHPWLVTEPARDPGGSTPFGAERDPARVIGFTDGVIAIATTLLVLQIRPPEDTSH